MPLVDSPLTSPYPLVSKVMDAARTKVNDTINDISGDLLTNDAPYSQTCFDLAYEWIQNKADTAGIELFSKEVVLYGVPARFNMDTANRSAISWTGCTDGVNNYESPVLPQDMISPKSMWRRRSVPLNADGSAGLNTNEFRLMTVANDGLPKWCDCDSYEWAEDAIYFHGLMNQAQDFNLRYSAYLPDVDITSLTATVPIMRCKNTMAARIGYEFASARGSTQASVLEASANDEFSAMKLRSGRRRGRKNIRRQPYNSRFGNSGRNFPYYVNS